MVAVQRRLVKLSSATGEIFEAEEVVALQSQFMRNVIEDVGVDVDRPIPLLNVSSAVLGQVLRYCRRFVEKGVNRTSNDEDSGDMENLYDLIMAANYMHVETLLHKIYHSLAVMISKKKLGEIRQIFNFGNDFARGEGCLVGNESQILASFIQSLPTELQVEIKIKVAQRFHHGEWSPWRYDADAQTLLVDLGNLYDVHNMHQQVAVIHLHIDIGLVNTLVLQTCGMMSLFLPGSGGAPIEWVDQAEIDLFKDLMDGIDRSKIEDLVFDEET